MENIYTNTPEISEKKAFRRHTEYINWGLLAYEALMMALSVAAAIGYVIVAFVVQIIITGRTDTDVIYDYLDRSDAGMGIAVLLTSLFLVLYMGKRVTLKEIFAPKRRMKASSFLMLLAVFMAVQLPATLFDDALESLLNSVGFTAESAIISASADSSSVTMFLYTGLIAPFAEEFAYRGYTLTAYRKAGNNKLLAIIMSAFFFGVMHGNPAQILFAACVGLVLGYVAVEYGILWSMLLHLLNNMVFGDLFNYAVSPLPEYAQNVMGSGMNSIFFCAGLIILYLKRRKIAQYIRENRCEGRHFKWSFLSVPLILFTVINLILAVTSIDKL